MTLRMIAWVRSLGRYLRLRSRIESEVDEEFRTHIEMRADDLVRCGLSRREARRRARAEFGGVERYKEEGRAGRGGAFRVIMLLEAFASDLKYASRALLNAKGASLIAVLAIGLGIGLTAVMYSIVHGFVDMELPYEDEERIVMAGYAGPQFALGVEPVSVWDYIAWHGRQRSFDALAAISPWEIFVNFRSAEHAVRYSAGFATVDLLEVLGIQPILGRGFTEDDGRPGAPLTVLISRRVWDEQFSADPNVLGRDVMVNGEDTRVIGVMEDRAGLDFPVPYDVWVPLRLDPATTQGGPRESLVVIGKVRDGVAFPRASEELGSISGGVAAERGDTEPPLVGVQRFADVITGPQTTVVLYAMLGSAMMVLLVACGTVANLLLARAAARTKDVALRTTLGASRARAVSQVMAEAAVLSTMGALVGIVIAAIGIDTIGRALMSLVETMWWVMELDRQVLGFITGTMILTALVIGVLPAWRGTASDVGSVLKDGSGASPSLRIGKLSRGLIVAQVTMSVALLVASGFMIKSLVAVARRDFPVPAQEILIADVEVLDQQFPDAATRRSFWEDVERNVSAVPGVRSVALASAMPGLGSGPIQFTTDRGTYPTERDVPRARRSVVSTEFFATFGVSPIQGRIFDRGDAGDASPVAVVNETFARRYLDGQPLGRRVRLGGLESDGPWHEVVGVVPDLFMAGLNNTLPASQAGFYTPLAQADVREISVAAVSAGSPLGIRDGVRAAVSAADPDTPVYRAETLRFLINQLNSINRVFGTLFALFGAAALFLASVGLYGVMSFTVTRRIPELGIRTALGATANQVGKMLVTQGMRLVVIGLALGSGLAILVVRALAPAIPGARLWDSLTYGLVFAVLTITGLLACAVPARRATRVDPMTALRAS